MAALPKRNWTVDEYLAFERDSDEKHEFVDGQVYAMTGASRNHVVVTVNTSSSLHAQLRKQPCIVYGSDLRVRIGIRDYVYPDVSIVCGEPHIETHILDTLLNPTVIIEVLSPSTEKYDRAEKFQQYRSLPSLQEYVLISQKTYHAERYTRQADGTWNLLDVDGVEASFELKSIGCTLALADVYEKVAFEEV